MDRKDSSKRVTKKIKSAREAFEELYKRFHGSFSAWMIASESDKNKLSEAMQRVFDATSSNTVGMDNDVPDFQMITPSEMQDTDPGRSTQIMLRSFYGYDASPPIVDGFHKKWFKYTSDMYRSYIITLLYQIVSISCRAQTNKGRHRKRKKSKDTQSSSHSPSPKKSRKKKTP